MPGCQRRAEEPLDEHLRLPAQRVDRDRRERAERDQRAAHADPPPLRQPDVPQDSSAAAPATMKHAAQRHPGGRADDAEPAVQRPHQTRGSRRCRRGGCVGRRAEDVVGPQRRAQVPGEPEGQDGDRGQPGAGDGELRVGQPGREQPDQHAARRAPPPREAATSTATIRGSVAATTSARGRVPRRASASARLNSGTIRNDIAPSTTSGNAVSGTVQATRNASVPPLAPKSRASEQVADQAEQRAGQGDHDGDHARPRTRPSGPRVRRRSAVMTAPRGGGTMTAAPGDQAEQDGEQHAGRAGADVAVQEVDRVQTMTAGRGEVEEPLLRRGPAVGRPAGAPRRAPSASSRPPNARIPTVPCSLSTIRYWLCARQQRLAAEPGAAGRRRRCRPTVDIGA